MRDSPARPWAVEVGEAHSNGEIEIGESRERRLIHHSARAPSLVCFPASAKLNDPLGAAASNVGRLASRQSGLRNGKGAKYKRQPQFGRSAIILTDRLKRSNRRVLRIMLSLREF